MWVSWSLVVEDCTSCSNFPGFGFAGWVWPCDFFEIDVSFGVIGFGVWVFVSWRVPGCFPLYDLFVEFRLVAFSDFLIFGFFEILDFWGWGFGCVCVWG